MRIYSNTDAMLAYANVGSHSLKRDLHMWSCARTVCAGRVLVNIYSKKFRKEMTVKKQCTAYTKYK